MDSPSLVGQLLVATPLLEDPNFRRAVVLVLDDDPVEGTLGVVVNRPSTLPVAEVLEEWGAYASEPGVMFMGGPVGTDAGFALGMSASGSRPPGWSPLGPTGAAFPIAGVGTVDLDASPAGAVGVGPLRVFAGYAGWGAGQLLDEIREGAWYLVAAQVEDVFCADPESLWARVLRRQGGDLALVSTFPDDPSLN
ncbi:YqgE/AlgH family protein [Marinactinospora thermotolerans]|uniref:UPF0301 protein SAMN02745673_02072 n=1 Tax=Marinactinospora thermotolerans DSM 45154 TaxID=1122192 RepID=A0A1T4Q6Q2_9ACTN|nr:YqgE/AlgH family protein [Marinactinospora thermotolerans]SJZ99440.1 putative transcriptional regulator [Marinactinospora thermotolerans DSM 45154]